MAIDGQLLGKTGRRPFFKMTVRFTFEAVSDQMSDRATGSTAAFAGSELVHPTHTRPRVTRMSRPRAVVRTVMHSAVAPTPSRGLDETKTRIYTHISHPQSGRCRKVGMSLSMVAARLCAEKGLCE